MSETALSNSRKWGWIVVVAMTLVAAGIVAKLLIPDYTPAVAIQNTDYAEARKQFHTDLLRKGPAPQEWDRLSPPAGVTQVQYTSGHLRLNAWINRPTPRDHRRYPAVLFLHGGYAFALSDWQMSQPYREAGFVVLSPMLRGENGQPGTFSMFYDEVDDVVNAAEYLRKQPYVDPNRIYVAGHSVGGTTAMLAAETYPYFRAAAAFSGSPDQVLFLRYAPNGRRDAPFNIADPREASMRSPLAYYASLKCPLRIYYGSEEDYLFISSQRMAELAIDHHLNVAAVEVPGNHDTHVPASIKLSIAFFNSVDDGSRPTFPHAAPHNNDRR